MCRRRCGMRICHEDWYENHVCWTLPMHHLADFFSRHTLSPVKVAYMSCSIAFVLHPCIIPAMHAKWWIIPKTISGYWSCVYKARSTEIYKFVVNSKQKNRLWADGFRRSLQVMSNSMWITNLLYNLRICSTMPEPRWCDQAMLSCWKQWSGLTHYLRHFMHTQLQGVWLIVSQVWFFQEYVYDVWQVSKCNNSSLTVLTSLQMNSTCKCLRASLCFVTPWYAT